MWKKTLSHPANNEKTIKKAEHRFNLAAGLAASIHPTPRRPRTTCKIRGTAEVHSQK
jgi:hypothetical protein